MKAVALVPARSGSVRVPGKNVRRLRGHPLLAYTICAARESGVFSRVIVSTDSASIADIARHYGAEVPFLRPPEMATSSSPDIEWVRHAVAWLTENNVRADVLALLRPTSPLRQPTSIRKAYSQFTATREFDSLRAVTRCEQHPMKMWTLSEDRVRLHPLMGLGDKDVPAHSRPYDTLPEVYVQDASLEVFWTTTVTDLGSISGDRVMAWLTPYPEGVDVNFPSDWVQLEQILTDNPEALPQVDRPAFSLEGEDHAR